MFLELEKKNRESIAVIDDAGCVATYGQLCDSIESFDQLGMPRCVVFCLCENSLGALAGYAAFESNGQVPLMLSAKIDRELLNNLSEVYHPSYYWIPEAFADKVEGEKVMSEYGYHLVKSDYEPYPLNEKLSLLMTTSGSTGSPKLVRHKYGNLEANARNVAAVFGWTPEERGVCDLPMNYTMGLNVINSHLYAGATVLMVAKNLMDPEMWDFVRDRKGTNFTGVPYSYEIMRRLRFERMDLPELKTMAEGGGKLTEKMFSWIAQLCSDTGRRFAATFGTTETSARLAFLDPEMALKKIGSIGKAIPEGEMFLADEIEDEEGFVSGELGYRGPNVTMGYAECREDLIRGDEFNGEYLTGDLARRDSEGYYFITGRKKRFVKLFGLRVSLDETERIIKSRFGCECVCTGNDKCMYIVITDESLKDEIRPYISEKTNLHTSAFKVFVVDEIPRNEYGKVKFAELEKLTGK